MVNQIEAQVFGFHIPPPNNWYRVSVRDISDNLSRLEMSDPQLTKAISDLKGTLLLVSYAKYNPSEHAGLIPSFQVNLWNNPTKTFRDFFLMVSKGSEEMRRAWDQFQYVDKPQIVKIASKQSVYFAGKFTVKAADGQILKARTRVYAIPKEDKFFQINLNDGDEDDCWEVYNGLLRSITFR